MNKHNRLAALMLALLLGAGVAQSQAQGSKPAEVPVADLAEAGRAQQALEEFIRAYETGNIGLLRSRLDPAMIGYQRFIDGMIQDGNRLKQIRIHLLDTQTLAGPDVAMIQTSWEKRFLSVTDLRPDINTGRSQFLMHRGKDGWRVAAVGGDNPFASQSGVLAQLGLRPTVDGGVRVEVLDPDLAGAGTMTVALSGGISVQVVLTETLPGRFSGSYSPGAGAIPAGTLIVLSYTDTNPGNGRPPSLLTRRITMP